MAKKLAALHDGTLRGGATDACEESSRETKHRNQIPDKFLRETQDLNHNKTKKRKQITKIMKIDTSVTVGVTVGEV